MKTNYLKGMYNVSITGRVKKTVGPFDIEKGSQLTYAKVKQIVADTCIHPMYRSCCKLSVRKVRA